MQMPKKVKLYYFNFCLKRLMSIILCDPNSGINILKNQFICDTFPFGHRGLKAETVVAAPAVKVKTGKEE